jgi:hypothetical protein
MPRYLSWLALAVAAGFLVVASVGFDCVHRHVAGLRDQRRDTAVSAGIAYGERHHRAAAIMAVLAAGVSAWTLVASLVFSSSTVQTLAFAGSLAVVGLSLVGLTEHELSHGAEQSSDTRKSRLAAAA